MKKKSRFLQTPIQPFAVEAAGGLRLIVAHLIQHRYVDCLVSTGANLYHDLHETRGQHHYVGSPHEDDAALADEHIDRVYDTYASEEAFCDNDNWIAAFAATLERLCSLWPRRS